MVTINQSPHQQTHDKPKPNRLSKPNLLKRKQSLAVAEANAIAAKVKQANSIAAAAPHSKIWDCDRQDSKLSDDERGGI